MALPQLIPPVLHPAVVHFPIVLLLVTTLLVLFQRRLPWIREALPWLLALAAASSVLTMATGFLQRADALEAWDGTAKESWIMIHLVLGLAVTIGSLLLATFSWIKRIEWSLQIPMPAVGSLVTVAALVAATGWYGGAIVWDALPDEGSGDQLTSEGGTNPFAVNDGSGDAGTTDPGSDPGSEPTPGDPDPPADPTPPPASNCPTFAPGAATGHTGGYSGFYGADTGVAGDSGLPIWEFTIVSGTSGGNHYYDDLEGKKVSTITVPACREVQFNHYNEGGAKHDLDIGDWQRKDPFVVDTIELSGGGQTTGSFEVEVTGSVAFYCSVGKHASMGQRGTFTVADAPA